MLVSVTTEPASEPISLEELKAHLKILHATEDAYLGTLIAAARAHLEQTCGTAFVAQTLEGYLPAFPNVRAIVLPKQMASVSFVKYRDLDGAEQTLPTSVYHAEPAGFLGRIELLAGEQWPATQPHPRAVTVRWVAGSAGAAADVKHAMKLLCGHWYFNRDLAGDGKANMPFAVEALLQKYKTHGWM